MPGDQGINLEDHMRKLFFVIAVLFGAGAMTATASNQALAAGGTNFSKAPGYEALYGSQAKPVAYFMHRKWYNGCYRPYWCANKYGHHYKSCWYGSCYVQKHYNMYQKHHHYSSHNNHHNPHYKHH